MCHCLNKIHIHCVVMICFKSSNAQITCKYALYFCAFYLHVKSVNVIKHTFWPFFSASTTLGSLSLVQPTKTRTVNEGILEGRQRDGRGREGWREVGRSVRKKEGGSNKQKEDLIVGSRELWVKVRKWEMENESVAKATFKEGEKENKNRKNSHIIILYLMLKQIWLSE